MDDFLHNLRSGKLKQSDRQNRPYGDQQYKGGPRRNMMDRRKREPDNKETVDRLLAIKDVLDALAESQKRMAAAYQERTRVEERKARAIEMVAAKICGMANPATEDIDALLGTKTPMALQSDTPSRERSDQTDADVLPVGALEDPIGNDIFEPDNDIQVAEADTTDPDTASAADGRLTELDRQTLYAVINQMRSEGINWESIARHIAGQGYPTVSGKGVWRGVMVKNLYEKLATA